MCVNITNVFLSIQMIKCAFHHCSFMVLLTLWRMVTSHKMWLESSARKDMNWKIHRVAYCIAPVMVFGKFLLLLVKMFKFHCQDALVCLFHMIKTMFICLLFIQLLQISNLNVAKRRCPPLPPLMQGSMQVQVIYYISNVAKVCSNVCI